MASYTDEKSGVIYNNVKTAGIDLGGPFVREGFIGVHPRSGGIVNMADVDWNGAQISGSNVLSTITSTSDLILILREMDSRLTVCEGTSLVTGITASPKSITLFTNGNDSISNRKTVQLSVTVNRK